ncbi:hypothetical protein HYU22_00200, partial [Candidatus Woesearchaeota archaeon]|nr:hypothetical protein [Candidatus Woesearchaeota archaeon]
TGATILEGNNYTFGFNCTDGVRLLGSNNISFNVDTSTPQVLVFRDFFGISRPNFTTGGIINLSVQLSNGTYGASSAKGTDFHAVYFHITNGSDATYRVNVTNATTGNGTEYNISLTQSNIRDGNHTVMVFTNDTAGNVNKSVAINTSFIV